MLDDYLEEDGVHLLTAMAAYPQLHWGLTRLLDLSLFPEPAADARERRLLKVARLPWSRSGWLPDWLRAALLERLDRPAWRALRRLYRELLRPEGGAGARRTALPVVLPRAVGLWGGLRDWLRQRGWRLGRWLGASRTLSAAHGALNDAIFADVLFGWRVPLLGFVLPRRLLRGHLGGSLRRAVVGHALVAALLAAAVAWLTAGAWERWGRAAEEERLLAGQNAAHAEYRVTVWHRPETAALSRALKETLAADGFAPEIAGTPLALPEGAEGELPAVNKIQWGDVADVPMAEQIKERLRYLAWGADPEVTDKLVVLAALADLAETPGPRELRVLLLTPGRTGSTFRDQFANSLTPEQIAELVTPPEAAKPQVQEPPPETAQPAEPSVKEVPPAAEPPPEPALPGQARVTAPPPEPSAADAGAADQLRGRIEALDQRWTELRDEMAREEQGLDGRAAGRGPKWRGLNEELQGVIAERDALAAQLRQLLGQTFRDPLKDGDEGPEMVALPGGTFLMGSPDTEPERASDEGPQHEVTVPPSPYPAPRSASPITTASPRPPGARSGDRAGATQAAGGQRLLERRHRPTRPGSARRPAAPTACRPRRSGSMPPAPAPDPLLGRETASIPIRPTTTAITTTTIAAPRPASTGSRRCRPAACRPMPSD